MKIDADLAKRIIDEAMFGRQRPVRQFHVDDLANQMRRGHFGAGTQLFFGRLGDRLYCVNGQHRLHAVMAASTEIEFQIAIEPATNEGELADLYIRHDRLARGRTTSEVLNSVGITDRFKVSARMAKSVFQAVPLLSSRFERLNYQTDSLIRDDDRRLGLGEQWWPYAVTYETLIKKAGKALRRRLYNPQVVAVAMATLRHQDATAAAFWAGVAANDGLRKGDPRHAFVNDEHQSHGTEPVFAAVAACAWNAFFAEKKITFCRVFDGAPIRISGTPYGMRH